MYRRALLATFAALAVPLALAAQTSGGADPMETECGKLDVRDRGACELAFMLERDFIYPEQGKAYAAMLRERIAAHAYRGLDSETVARRMTADLLAVSPDGHLRVELAPPPSTDRVGPAGEGGADGAPPALVEGDWLAPGLAYVRIDGFSDRASDIADIRKFLSDHARAETLIIDLRANGGGQFFSLDAIMPYLFAEPRRLVSMANRRHVDEVTGGFLPKAESLRMGQGEGDLTVREHWSLKGDKAALQNAGIFVLTSPRTGSAAEHLAFSLKVADRAVLVGKPTGGANHFGGLMPIAGGLQAFIPLGRTYDPKTGADWEGKGVTPHIDIAPADALAFVLRQKGMSEADATRIAVAHTPSADAMAKWSPAT